MSGDNRGVSVLWTSQKSGRVKHCLIICLVARGDVRVTCQQPSFRDLSYREQQKSHNLKGRCNQSRYKIFKMWVFSDFLQRPISIWQQALKPAQRQVCGYWSAIVIKRREWSRNSTGRTQPTQCKPEPGTKTSQMMTIQALMFTCYNPYHNKIISFGLEV